LSLTITKTTVKVLKLWKESKPTSWLNFNIKTVRIWLTLKQSGPNLSTPCKNQTGRK
jgi:hypothetical protein